MSAFFLDLGKTVIFFSTSPHTLMISSMVVLAPLKEVAKTLPVVNVNAVVGVKLLATILAGKYIATVREGGLAGTV